MSLFAKNLFAKKLSFNLIFLTTGFTLPFAISAYTSRKLEYNRTHSNGNVSVKAGHRPRLIM
ncbi:hypothetical protein DAKH74_041100 [Maudiozyma humilis]|uniref:Uncharacterized protein n=1 Tax=Maudiozyma humilis TaxID=51915 RepID=A0AAV5S0V3_MAUHU|nr:hypothetical protein DAKH74_041100 [Kazachstania humilis]